MQIHPLGVLWRRLAFIFILYIYFTYLHSFVLQNQFLMIPCSFVFEGIIS